MRTLAVVLCAQMLMLLCACGAAPEEEKESLLERYQTAQQLSMEAQVRFGSAEQVEEYTLRCDWYADGSAEIEVMEPEDIAGLKASVDGEDLTLIYEDMVLPAGELSSEEISPAMALPVLMRSVREGWLLEESREDWGEVPCVRLSWDLTGENGGKVLSALWIRKDDGTPVHGEITVDEEIILQVEFTDFTFGATIGQELTEGASS